MVRSRYFIPIVLISFPFLGLVLGSLLGDQLSIPSTQPPFWNLSGMSDGYEAGGVLGFRVSILCAILVVARRIYKDRK